MKRRNLIRLMIGLGIGIPILTEILTFSGLIGKHFFDIPWLEEEGEEQRLVGIGDEVLTETPQTETLESGVIERGEDTWSLTITVAVDNPTQDDYELTLGNVVADGQESQGGDSVTVPPGESREVTSTWEIPRGSTPTQMDVTARADGETVERTVQLGKIPVRG
ncbi:MAG: hypothetical protein SV253_09175 [Halobacteria archaeon]|nr:hypothetical protein [Halobacteria archaeon]